MSKQTIFEPMATLCVFFLLVAFYYQTAVTSLPEQPSLSSDATIPEGFQVASVSFWSSMSS
jgi:hypothetical protein